MHSLNMQNYTGNVLKPCVGTSQRVEDRIGSSTQLQDAWKYSPRSVSCLKWKWKCHVTKQNLAVETPMNLTFLILQVYLFLLPQYFFISGLIYSSKLLKENSWKFPVPRKKIRTSEFSSNTRLCKTYHIWDCLMWERALVIISSHYFSYYL